MNDHTMSAGQGHMLWLSIIVIELLSNPLYDDFIIAAGLGLDA